MTSFTERWRPVVGWEGCHGDGNPKNNCQSNLRWDTKASIERDKILHGTARLRFLGADNGSAKLTEDQVREIRARCAGGETRRSVAADFGISHNSVSKIHHRRAWAHVA